MAAPSHETTDRKASPSAPSILLNEFTVSTCLTFHLPPTTACLYWHFMTYVDHRQITSIHAIYAVNPWSTSQISKLQFWRLVVFIVASRHTTYDR